MYRKNFIVKDVKGVSKDIKKNFLQVVDGLELDLRVKSTNKQQNLEKMQIQLKKMASKINQFSNLLLEDDFSFDKLQQHPLILTRYCESMFTILIHTLNDNVKQKSASQTHKNYNENNIYEVAAATRLQNFDLKQKIKSLENQLLLSKQRAQCSEEIAQTIKSNSQDFLKSYKQNFTVVCDMLKSAEGIQLQLLQNNRFLKEQLQSLSIQFERYKEYFKLGPSLKEKQFKMKNQLEKQYEKKISNAIKQVQTCIRNQIERSVVEKFHLKDIKNLKI